MKKFLALSLLFAFVAPSLFASGRGRGKSSRGRPKGGGVMHSSISSNSAVAFSSTSEPTASSEENYDPESEAWAYRRIVGDEHINQMPDRIVVTTLRRLAQNIRETTLPPLPEGVYVEEEDLTREAVFSAWRPAAIVAQDPTHGPCPILRDQFDAQAEQAKIAHIIQICAGTLDTYGTSKGALTQAVYVSTTIYLLRQALQNMPQAAISAIRDDFGDNLWQIARLYGNVFLVNTLNEFATEPRSELEADCPVSSRTHVTRRSSHSRSYL